VDPAAALERRPVRLGVIGAGVVAIVAVAVVAGSGIVGARTAIVLAAGLAGALGLTALAVVRYEVFLAFLITARASLDVIKVGGGGSVDATGAISVLFIGATFLWLLRSDGSLETPTAARPILLPLLALLGAGAISVAASDHPLDSSLELVRMGTVVVIVLALGHVVRSWDDVRRFLIAFFCSALVPILVAASELVRGGGRLTPEGVSRINGTFQHPNPFGAYLFLVIVLAVALFPHVSTRWRWGLGTIAVAAAGILVTTYTRGAWVATVIGLAIVGLLQSRRVLWLMGASVLAAVLLLPSVGSRLSDLSQERTAFGAPGNSLVWRFEYWQQALALQDDPVFGIGLRGIELEDDDAAAAHNDYVRLYVETGIVGLLAYLWLFVTLYREAIRTYRRAPPGVGRGLAVALLATLTGIVILSMAANVISQLVILWYFAAIIVLALVAAQLPSSPALREA
jgi:putative inorganic carbon (HCO3(-)) transporter